METTSTGNRPQACAGRQVRYGINGNIIGGFAVLFVDVGQIVAGYTLEPGASLGGQVSIPSTTVSQLDRPCPAGDYTKV